MKKIIAGIISVLLILTLVGCSNNQVEKATQQSKQTKIEKSESSNKSTSSNKSVATTSSQSSTQESLWNASKKQALVTFMNEFGTKMKQSYREAGPGNDTHYAGLHYPTDFSKNNLTFDEAQQTVTWSNDGSGNAHVNVVDIYVNNDNLTMGGHIYLFAIVDGQPVVYHTSQNQDIGDHLIHFTTTENAELKNEFENIVHSN